MSLNIQTSKKIELINITKNVAEKINNTSVINGACIISSQHTTTAIFVNEDEPRLLEDILKLLSTLVPDNGKYQHNSIDNNASAHLKSLILGNSQCIPIIDSRLILGTWQNIFLAEFDGPRNRKIDITILNQD